MFLFVLWLISCFRWLLDCLTFAFDARMEAPLWRRVPVSPASCRVTIKEWRHRMPQVSPRDRTRCGAC
eukprot:s1680_g10.t1